MAPVAANSCAFARPQDVVLFGGLSFLLQDLKIGDPPKLH